MLPSCHAYPLPRDPPWTPMKRVLYAIMFYVLRAFLPSLPGGCRYSCTRISESKRSRLAGCVSIEWWTGPGPRDRV
eukprot:5768554-Prymnesium_polylepis.1